MVAALEAQIASQKPPEKGTWKEAYGIQADQIIKLNRENSELETKIDKLNDELNVWLAKDSLLNGEINIYASKLEDTVHRRDDRIDVLEAQLKAALEAGE
jgi:phage shock protein A